MLKLTNDPDELVREFHDKIPQIDDVLGLWGELKEASQRTAGEAQLRARASVAEDQVQTSEEEGKGTIFNLVRDLDTPGRAEVVYLTSATEDMREDAKDSNVPSNLRTIDWLNFDGSYVHLEDSEPKKATSPVEPDFDIDEYSMRRNSSRSDMRPTEWLKDEQYTDLLSEATNSMPDSEAAPSVRETGPYEAFWNKYDPSELQLALNIHEGELSTRISH